MVEFNPSLLFRIVEVTGVLSSGLMAAALARSLKFDIIGFAVLAITTALGGGMLRDVLLSTMPVALTDPIYMTGAIIATVLGYLINMSGQRFAKLLSFTDLLALGCWATTGTLKAMAFGLAPLACIILGTITVVGGGVIRDVLAGRVPVIFGGNELYATVALFGSILALIIAKTGHTPMAMGVCIISCLLLGWFARRHGWSLPRGGIDLASGRMSRVFRIRGLRRTKHADAPTGSIEAIKPPEED
uniref:trimeric intracellular cation channel family protein n=1 Tax=Vaginimicrobium propionicum TaxID=1871034 RepID=UPI0009FB643C|nr:TRIC cation channel family protein [Vaginimicrobium propionicum]